MCIQSRETLMAHFRGIALVDPTASATTSGAVFQLSGAPRIDAVVQVPNGRTIEIRSDTPIVVARASNAANHADALREALSIAQQGLDLLSIEGKADLSTREVDDWH